PPLLAVKIASIIFATAVIFFFYFFLKRWQIRWPLFYTLILLSIPAFVFRINLAKAGPLSIIVLLIALSLIWQKRYWALGILSFFYVWLHGGWGLMIILAACAIISDLLINKWALKRINWKLIATVTIGLTAGLIINPSFPNNLQFYWEQVVQIGLINYQGIVAVGVEWYPMKITDFLTTNVLGWILTIGTFSVFLWRVKTGGATVNKEKFKQILTLYIFSGLLAVMTLKSMRFIEYFAPFFILANAFLLDFSLPQNFSPRDEIKKFWKKNAVNKIIVSYLLITWLVVFIGKNIELRDFTVKGFSWQYLAGASEWLKQNTPERSLIFHTQWSDWPMLFYHNSNNVYTAGMDPTFFYRYDQELYKTWVTIGARQETKPEEKIKNDFGTNILLLKLTEKKLLEQIEKNPQFVLKYEDKEAKIFEIQ
ncbi:MAG TPA: hypothetical protein DEB73_01235, partial [Candidatus Magasanikbacteria bacterium]|nr:hypothetical protein [Candidatus Magasanikbacteria bacterium]